MSIAPHVSKCRLRRLMDMFLRSSSFLNLQNLLVSITPSWWVRVLTQLLEYDVYYTYPTNAVDYTHASVGRRSQSLKDRRRARAVNQCSTWIRRAPRALDLLPREADLARTARVWSMQYP